MRGEAAYIAGFGGVEGTTRIHPHRAPGGHGPFGLQAIQGVDAPVTTWLGGRAYA